MATLEALLGNVERAGPHELPIGSIEELASAAKALGYPFAHLDLTVAHDKDDLLAALAMALNLPEWFGNNWDALIDCLCDLSWKPAPGYVLLMEGHDALRIAHPEDFDTALEVFSEVADYWRDEDIAFWTLLTPPADGTHFLPALLAG